jgi:hypothetical protein
MRQRASSGCRSGQVILVHGRRRKPAWKALVEEALQMRGERSRLSEIYRVIEPKRPATHQRWRERTPRYSARASGK